VTGHDVACHEDGNTTIAMGCLLSCIVENVQSDPLLSVMDEGVAGVILRFKCYSY
jgi:hypothetical protein